MLRLKLRPRDFYYGLRTIQACLDYNLLESCAQITGKRVYQLFYCKCRSLLGNTNESCMNIDTFAGLEGYYSHAHSTKSCNSRVPRRTCGNVFPWCPEIPCCCWARNNLGTLPRTKDHFPRSFLDFFYRLQRAGFCPDGLLLF